jgi:hypothetical protein
MTRRNFQLLRVLGSALRLKAEAGLSSRDQKDFICREEAACIWTQKPMGQVGNWVFKAFFIA